jgi:uncharacterized damage-inducible protein DinB
MRTVRSLYDHLWWADDLVLGGLEAAGSPPPAAVELLAHVLAAELVWLDRLEGVAQSVPVWPEADLAHCRGLAETSRRRWAVFIAALEDGDLTRSVAYRNSAGKRFENTVEEILLHVALHGAYHRGQIARGLRRAGFEPVATDFIAFARGAPAATREDAAS